MRVLAILIWGNAFMLQSCHNQMQTSRTDLGTELYPT